MNEQKAAAKQSGLNWPGLKWHSRAKWSLAIAICLSTALAAAAQASADSSSQPGQPSSASSQNEDQATGKPATHITPEQARKLFSLVDELIKFSSDETGLPILSTVKRQLTTRAEVEKYLTDRMNDDQDAKRMQQDEIVLKKFGLLDRDFDLKPFLVALLKDQIEAYYDSKTKTVNMLDWVSIDEQKPVLAHELTHALQDQHTDLDKWNDQTPEDVSTNAADDKDHLAKDEMDTARDAIAEGQATAVMMDYSLKPLGKSLVKDPEVMNFIKNQMSNDDSPMMARAPILLSESMLFPYRDGLSFEQDIWMDQGQKAAFAGALDQPPTSSWEIMNPREYEKHSIPPIPLMPNIHPLVDATYKPYDIGQIGQLDLHMLTRVIGGDKAAADLTPAWNGGIYWAGQARSAKTPAEQSSTKSLAFFYLSSWRNPRSAQAFAKLYADSLGRKYSSVKLDDAAAKSANTENGATEVVYSTNEGPVAITTRGSLVFVSESFPLDLARKLSLLLLDAQGGGEMQMAGLPTSNPPSANSAPNTHPEMQPLPTSLSASFVRFFQNSGVMKAAVDAAMAAGR